MAVRLTQSVKLVIVWESTLKYKVKTIIRTLQEFFKKSTAGRVASMGDGGR